MIALRRYHRWLVPGLLLALVLPLLVATLAQPRLLHAGPMASALMDGHCDTAAPEGSLPQGHRTGCGLLLPCDHGGCASVIVPDIAVAGLEPPHRSPPATVRAGIARPILPGIPPPRALS